MPTYDLEADTSANVDGGETLMLEKGVSMSKTQTQNTVVATAT